MLRATETITSSKNTTTRGIVYMALAMLIFATQDAVSKHLVGTYSVPQIMWVRYICFMMIALVLVSRKGGVRIHLSKRPWLQVLRCIIMVAETATIVTAFSMMPMADVHAIFALSPLIVTALSVVILKEYVGARRWMAVIIGFCGMIIILRPGLTDVSTGALWTLLGATLFAFYVILTRKVSEADTSETSFMYLAIVGLIVTSILGPFYWVPPDTEGLGFMILLACMAAVGHLLLMKALEAAPASLLQPLNYTLLVWATIVGFIVFGDFPDSYTIVGAVIIAASGLYTIYREQIKSRQK